MTRDEIKAKVEAIFAALDAKRSSGLCVWPDCSRRAHGSRAELFFGDDHCETHAKQAELECLIDDQKDDAAGLEP